MSDDTTAGTPPDTTAETPPDTRADPTIDSTPGRLRSVGTALVGIAGIVCLVGGILGLWTVQTATDTERFEERVEELVQDEEISDALARRVVTEVADGIGIRDAVVDVLPEPLVPAADFLLAGVRSRVDDRVAELIRTDEVARGVAVVAGRSHEAAVAVLEGENSIDGVDISDGEVTINLLPLTNRVLGLLQSEFGLFRDVDLPEMDRSGDPDEQRAALEEAFGRDLPDDFGTPVVFESERLDEVGNEVQALRDVFTLAKRAFWILLVAGAVLVGLSIWLARQRWRAACYLVAGLFATTLVVSVAGNQASDRLPDVVESPGARATVGNITAELTDDLDQTLFAYSTVALMILVAAAVVLIGAPWASRRNTDRADTE